MIRRLFKITIYLCLLIILAGLFCFYSIRNESEDFITHDVSKVVPCKTGLVLGTSRLLANGTENLYFSYRIDAAEKLFKSGKVKYLILSGDNRVNDYNEPKEMKKQLIKKGVPDSCIILDYAGLRTFDSMIRCKQIFGQDSVVVVSQEFHNQRAVYIAKHIGLTAFGYNAQEVTSQSALKIKFREFFSRIKCMLDLYILNTQPKHLGEKTKIA